MKKFLLASMLASLLIMPAVSLAATCSDFEAEDTCLNANCLWNPDEGKCVGVYITSASDVITIIQRIGNWIFAILMAVAGVFLMYSGFLWVTAGGNTENVTKAKQMLTNAIIGMVIALLSRGIVMAIVKVLGA